MTTDPISTARRLNATMSENERANINTITALGWVYQEPPDDGSGCVVIATRGDYRIGVTQYPELRTATVHVRIEGSPEGPRGDVLRSEVLADLLPTYLAAITRMLDEVAT